MVPAPGHVPPQSDRQPSSTIALVQALQSKRLGVAGSLLRRVSKLNKAAWSPPGERTLSSVDQIEQIVDPVEDGRITLVDEDSTRRQP